MPLAKTGTCMSCGYEKIHCICNQANQAGTIYRRNTSGDIARDQHWQNYNTVHDQYSETSRLQYNRSDTQRKFMTEFHPVSGETLDTYISRTSTAVDNLIDFAINKHIYGGRKPWPSHTNSSYCPVCIPCQYINNLTEILIEISKLIDVSQFTFKIEKNVNPLDTKIELIDTTTTKDLPGTRGSNIIQSSPSD